MDLRLYEPWAIHGTLPRSRVNGPGDRFVVWTQGCSLACPGCFNPESHATGTESATVGSVLHSVLQTTGLEGLTISGGEPLEQPVPLRAFAEAIRDQTDLGLILLTGFTIAEIRSNADRWQAAKLFDMLIAGRYLRRQHLAMGLRGSSNKAYFGISERYSEADLAELGDAEITISADGQITLTGIAPPTPLEQY